MKSPTAPGGGGLVNATAMSDLERLVTGVRKVQALYACVLRAK